jgi:hypothetical protein
MNDDRIDFSPLDPTRDPVRHARAVHRIMDRAALPLAARRARTTTIGQVTRWWRPMLALAAALAVAAIGVLTQVTPAAATAREPGVAEALGIPTVVATWMTTGEAPTGAQVFAVFEEIP